MMGKEFKMSKILSVVVLSATMILMGCGSSSQPGQAEGSHSAGDKPVTIRFAHGWAASGDTAVGAEYIKKFKEDNKDTINLVEEVVAGDEMLTKIKVDLAADNLPDAWMYWGSMVDCGSLIRSGLLADVGEYFKESKTAKMSDYPESMFDSFKFNGKAYGIPTESYVGFWFCNKELFEKYNLDYPKTYEDLIKVAKVFHENGIVPLAMGSKGGNPSHFFLSELFCQYKGAKENFARLSNEWKIDDANFKKVADLILDMKKNNVFPSDTVANGDWGPSFALYNEGKAAMVYTMTWMLTALSSETEAKTVLINAPRLPGADVDPSTFVSSNSTYGMVINAKSFADPVKRKALVKLADMFTSDEWVENMFYKTGMLNAKTIKIDESKMTKPILFTVVDDASKKEKMSCHWLAYPDGEPFYYFTDRLDELFAGSISADEFVSRCQKSLDEAKEEQ